MSYKYKNINDTGQYSLILWYRPSINLQNTVLNIKTTALEMYPFLWFPETIWADSAFKLELNIHKSRSLKVV